MYLFEDYSPQSIIFANVFGRFLNRTFMELKEINPSVDRQFFELWI